MSNFLFKDRDGNTPLPEGFREHLKFSHIHTIGELDEFEEANISNGLIWLEKQGDDPVDHYFWRRLHRELFSDVWTWAGEVRKHEILNPDFNKPYEIWDSLKQLQDDMTYWLENETFPADAITARFHERFETIHPFTNGNGRTGRILVEHICTHYEFQTPTWGVSQIGNRQLRRNTYIESIDKARLKHSYDDLKDFMYS